MRMGNWLTPLQLGLLAIVGPQRRLSRLSIGQLIECAGKTSSLFDLLREIAQAWIDHRKNSKTCRTPRTSASTSSWVL
jgi:hypothetical protein